MKPFNQNSQDNQTIKTKDDRTMDLQKKMNALLMPALEEVQSRLKEGEDPYYSFEDGGIYTLDMRFTFDIDEYEKALEDGDKSEDDYLYDLYMEEKGGKIELPLEIGQLVDEYCEYFLQLDVSCDVEPDSIFVSSKAYASFA